jgi:hypothetical protein
VGSAERSEGLMRGAPERVAGEAANGVRAIPLPPLQRFS